MQKLKDGEVGFQSHHKDTLTLKNAIAESSI